MTDTISPASIIVSGTIIPYLCGRQTNPPDGWLYCNGAYISRATYGDLFAAIGVTYGSTTSSNFRLPLSSVLFRGASSIGLGTTSTNHSHTFSFGTSGTLGSAGSGHNHSMNAPATSDPVSDAHNHNQSNNYNSGSNSGNFLAVSGSANILAGDSHTHAVYHSYDSKGGSHSHAGVVGSSGSGAEHSHNYSIASAQYGASGSANSLPPCVYMAHIIKT